MVGEDARVAQRPLLLRDKDHLVKVVSEHCLDAGNGRRERTEELRRGRIEAIDIVIVGNINPCLTVGVFKNVEIVLANAEDALAKSALQLAARKGEDTDNPVAHI